MKSFKVLPGEKEHNRFGMGYVHGLFIYVLLNDVESSLRLSF